MNSSEIKGDFTGFTFGGVHCSDYNIVRVSDGSRYNENLVPAIQDKTVEVPGADGTYYFNSYYTSRPFVLNIAFDEVSELQFRQMRQWLGSKDLQQLIFDERPYKYYMAKVQTAPDFKYVCFDDATGARVYKGEATVQFICYYPFAKSVYRYLSNFDEEIYTNIDEWEVSCGMLTNDGGIYDQIPEITKSDEISLINMGDLPCNFKLYLQGTVTKITCTIGNEVDSYIETNSFTTPEGKYVCYNTKNNLLEGYDSIADGAESNGTLYNEYITGGSFKPIPLTEYSGTTPISFDIKITGGAKIYKIEYDYIYY